MSQLPTLHELIPLLPELVLACGAMAMLMLGVAIGERSGAVVNGFCFIVLLLAGAALSSVPPGTHAMFGGSFLVDDYARFLKLLTLVGSGGALLLSLDYLTVENQQKFEYGTLFLLSTLGMLMLISASDLIALYLGLELMSLPLYVIAASNRENVRSTEAGLKYFVLGALSSGMLLYGASLIYGFTGTINFTGIAKATQSGASVGLIIGLVFLFVGFCFKISAVPFHMWTSRRFSPPRRKSPALRFSHVQPWWRFRASRMNGNRLWCSFRSRRWRSAALLRSVSATSSA